MKHGRSISLRAACVNIHQHGSYPVGFFCHYQVKSLKIYEVQGSNKNMFCTSKTRQQPVILHFEGTRVNLGCILPSSRADTNCKVMASDRLYARKWTAH